jgi:hypothetical protein
VVTNRVHFANLLFVMCAPNSVQHVRYLLELVHIKPASQSRHYSVCVVCVWFVCVCGLCVCVVFVCVFCACVCVLCVWIVCVCVFVCLPLPSPITKHLNQLVSYEESQPTFCSYFLCNCH